MRDIWQLIKATAIVWIPFGGLLLAMIALEQISCHSKWDLPTRWGMIAGCQVQTSQGWIPADNYRMVD